MEEYPFALAHGYIVVPSRNDYRISIEGVSGDIPDECDMDDFKADFEEFFAGADEITVGPDRSFHCWFD
jgi:hypothetical protein